MTVRNVRDERWVSKELSLNHKDSSTATRFFHFKQWLCGVVEEAKNKPDKAIKRKPLSKQPANLA